MKKLLMATLIGCGALGATPVLASQAFTLTSPSPFRNASWSFGQIFTVGSQNITVDALGAYDHNGDGFISIAGIPVGIFRESDGALLSSTSVQDTDPLTAFFRYAAIPDLTLLANTAYRVVAVNSGDFYNSDHGFSVNPAITYAGYGACSTPFLTSCNTFTGSGVVPMANFDFKIDEGGVGGVPEPGAWALMLGGFGLMGSVLRRRRAILATA